MTKGKKVKTIKSALSMSNMKPNLKRKKLPRIRQLSNFQNSK